MIATRLVWLGLLAGVASCGGAPEPVHPLAPRPVREVESWSLSRTGAALGRMALLEIADPATPVRFYRIENVDGQWLGNIDTQGRVYRSVPFADREEFCGIYPMQDGLALLFEVEGRIDISEPLSGATEASAEKDQ